MMRQMYTGMAGETITEVRPVESCSDDDWVVKSSSTRKNMPIETKFLGENINLIISFCEGSEKSNDRTHTFSKRHKKVAKKSKINKKICSRKILLQDLKYFTFSIFFRYIIGDITFSL